MENVGPGSYANVDGTRGVSKKFGTGLAAAFGVNSNRILDTTEPGVINNPGPG